MGGEAVLQYLTEQDVSNSGIDFERGQQLLSINSLLPMTLWQLVQWLKQTPEVGPLLPIFDFNPF